MTAVERRWNRVISGLKRCTKQGVIDNLAHCSMLHWTVLVMAHVPCRNRIGMAAQENPSGRAAGRLISRAHPQSTTGLP